MKIIPRIALAIILNVTLVVGSLYARTITGKVVGVADGDTITVLEEATQFTSGWIKPHSNCHA